MKGLDRYLTSEPDNGFDNWCDNLLNNHISNDLYNIDEDWFCEPIGKCNQLLNVYFSEGKSPKEGGQRIERYYRLFLLNKTTKN